MALVAVGDGGYDVADDGDGDNDDGGGYSRGYRGDGGDGDIGRDSYALMVVIGGGDDFVLSTNQEYPSDIKQDSPGDRVGPSRSHPLESHGR